MDVSAKVCALQSIRSNAPERDTYCTKMAGYRRDIYWARILLYWAVCGLLAAVRWALFLQVPVVAYLRPKARLLDQTAAFATLIAVLDYWRVSLRSCDDSELNLPSPPEGETFKFPGMALAC